MSVKVEVKEIEAGSSVDIGAVGDASVTNPALDGSIISLLKGALELQSGGSTVDIDQTTPGTTNGVSVNGSPNVVGGVIGASQDLIFAESIAADVETIKTYTQPTSPKWITEVVVFNDSTVSELLLQFFTYDGSAYSKITNIVVPISAALAATTATETHTYHIAGLWSGGTSCRVIASNVTLLGVGEGFTGTLLMRQV